jgi:hypothetical protein
VQNGSRSGSSSFQQFVGPPSWDGDSARRGVEVRARVADQLRLGMTAGHAFRLTRDRPRSRLSGSTQAYLGNVGSPQHGNRTNDPVCPALQGERRKGEFDAVAKQTICADASSESFWQ